VTWRPASARRDLSIGPAGSVAYRSSHLPSATVKGNVYELNNVADFAGEYEAAEPGFPLGGEKPSWNPKDEGLTLRNNKGVVVHVWTVESGPRLRVLRGGVQVTLKSTPAKPVAGY